MTPDPSEAFARAYQAASLLIAANPQLIGFAGWPQATPAPKAPRPVPAATLLRQWAEGTIEATVSLRDSVQDIADYADWQLSYTEE